MPDDDTTTPTPPAINWRSPIFRAVVALGFTQIIAWGTSLYSLGILGKPIAAATGWSTTFVFGGMTLGLLVSGLISTTVGRWSDRVGAQRVMALGSLVMTAGLASLALATSQPAYLTAWALTGIAMRMSLYDAAFAALVQVSPRRGRQAISYLTLFGGLASAIFWPIGWWLEPQLGWRGTYLVFAAINLLICFPLNWYGLAARKVDVTTPTATAAHAATPSDRPHLQGRQRSRAMLLFAVVMAASAFCFGAMAAHLVPTIASTGVGVAAAVGLASIKGVSQTLARLCDILFGKRLHPISLGRITLAILPLSFLVLFLAGTPYLTALAFTILFGAANGLTTIVRGTVPLALFGPEGFGEILGRLATPYLVLNAVAPMVFAMLETRFGITAAIVSVAVAAALACLSIEIMSAWYWRQMAPAASGIDQRSQA